MSVRKYKGQKGKSQAGTDCKTRDRRVVIVQTSASGAEPSRTLKTHFFSSKARLMCCNSPHSRVDGGPIDEAHSTGKQENMLRKARRECAGG